MQYRARVDGKEIMVQVGADLSIWTWKLGRGQVTLANSEDAYLWALAHVVPEDLVHIRNKLRPSPHQYMQSQIAG